ncbi:MAG: type II toxin-antitoxin system VapC family toxin [Gemmataceae bacterium]|nr:type II toxin-antitoxin system VapC family toxin [Gemmataceae bacterium]
MHRLAAAESTANCCPNSGSISDRHRAVFGGSGGIAVRCRTIRSIHRANHALRVEQIRKQFASLPFDDAAAEIYGAIRADLTGRGMLIGGNDMMIAAIALAKSCTLVPHNTAEFSRVAGLAIEDWQLP